MKRAEVLWLAGIVVGSALYFGRPTGHLYRWFNPSATIGRPETGKHEGNYAREERVKNVLFGPHSVAVGVKSPDGDTFVFGADLREETPPFVVLRGRDTTDPHLVEAGNLTRADLKRVFDEITTLPPSDQVLRPLVDSGTIYSVRLPGNEQMVFDGRAKAFARSLPSTFVGQLFRKHGWSGR